MGRFFYHVQQFTKILLVLVTLKEQRVVFLYKRSMYIIQQFIPFEWIVLGNAIT